jgi:hypothetical protein
MVCYHSINGITNNNNLKGASMNQEFLFNQKDMNFIDQVLKVAGYKVSKLEPQTEEHKRIIDNVGQSLKIISAKTKNQNQNQSSTKGASLDNKFQNLQSICNMFGIGNKGNKSINQLKGASKNNNNICSKKQSLKNIREHFNLI